MDSIPAQDALAATPRLLDQVRGKIRLKHYSLRTEQTYVDWIKRFIRHFCKRHPRDLGAAEVEAFLTHLAVVGRVAASTRNQARSALLFLYREVLMIYTHVLNKGGRGVRSPLDGLVGDGVREPPAGYRIAA